MIVRTGLFAGALAAMLLVVGCADDAQKAQEPVAAGGAGVPDAPGDAGTTGNSTRRAGVKVVVKHLKKMWVAPCFENVGKCSTSEGCEGEMHEVHERSDGSASGCLSSCAGTASGLQSLVRKVRFESSTESERSKRKRRIRKNDKGMEGWRAIIFCYRNHERVVPEKLGIDGVSSLMLLLLESAIT